MIQRPKLTYANVMSTIAVFIALGGTSYAVARNSIGTQHLRSGAVTSAKISNGAVTSAKIRNGTIAKKDLASTLARGPRGGSGPAGPAGPAGPPGPPGPAPAEGWRALSFVNGWTNYGDVWETGAYRKDQLGIVRLRGLVSRNAGSMPLNAPIAILPVGFRPQRARIFVVHMGEPHQVGRVDVTPSGQVHWSSGAAAQNYVSLEGITFDTE